VVDDEPMVCESVKRMLMFDAYEVETAHCASEALELMEKNQFDLVITDYEMPEVKGDELAAIIKAKSPHQPVALITAYAEVLQSGGVPLAGVDLVISKPFDLQEMRRAIAKLLKGHARPRDPSSPPAGS
jgi:CheY-like chemotaxis protein